MDASAVDELAHSSVDRVAVANVLGRLGSRLGLLATDSRLAQAVVAVAGASNRLGHLLVDDPDALDDLCVTADPVLLSVDVPEALARTY
jgi:hypothetical protein